LEFVNLAFLLDLNSKKVGVDKLNKELGHYREMEEKC